MRRLLLQGRSSQGLSQVLQDQSGVSPRNSFQMLPAWAGRGRRTPAASTVGRLSSLKSEPNHPFSAGNTLAEGQTWRDSYNYDSGAKDGLLEIHEPLQCVQKYLCIGILLGRKSSYLCIFSGISFPKKVENY